MLRDRQYKYVHYVNARPQLFDLLADRDEVHDLAQTDDGQALVREYAVRLRALLDPEAVDAQAKADQTARVAVFGGEAKVRARGTFTNSPAPGEDPGFQTYP
jgi:choline-sulfatase